MSITAADVLLDPADTDGTPVGVGDWRLTVQAWLPAHDTSLVGVAQVGVDVVSNDVWTDLADWVTGVEIVDAAAYWGEHPEPAVCRFTLRSPDHRFAAWKPAGTPGNGHRFIGGTPVRVVLFDPVADDYHPLFTGEIETAEEQTAGVDAVGQVTVTAVDTAASRLGKVQLVDYTIDPTASGRDIADVIGDLLTAASWPYGSVIDVQSDDAGDPYYILGETLVNGTVYEQLRRLADACGRQVGADRNGRLAFVRRRPQITNYTNAYTPAADPNLPAAFTVDTATDGVIADTCLPSFAVDAIVNSVELRDLVEPGIYTPATVGPGAAASRLATTTNATVADGIRSGSTQTVVTIKTGALHRINSVSESSPDSITRYGLRQLAAADLFPIYYGFFVGEQIAARTLELRSCATGRDLWNVPLELDERAVDLIAPARVGSPATVDHDGATFTGHIAALTITSTPLKNRCRLVAQVTVNAYSIDKGA